MKLLIDFTEEELANITAEQKQQLFLLELANRGVALPSAVPAYMDSPENRDDLQPDITVYTIGSGYSNDYYFETIEAAKAAAELISSSIINVDFKYGSGNYNKCYYVTDRDRQEISVKPIAAFSMDRYSALKDELKRYEDQKSKIDRNNKRRSELLDKHAEIMQEIDEAIIGAEKNINRISELASMFSEYLTMANQNHEIAARFMLNAHYSELLEYTPEKLKTIGITEQDIKIHTNTNEVNGDE